MYFVYIIRSIKYQNKVYTGVTNNIKRRLQQHNSGMSHFTNQFKPWKYECLIGFNNRAKTEKFERYLKSGSGIAFSRKRLLN